MLSVALLFLIPFIAHALTAPFPASNGDVVCHHFDNLPMSPPSCNQLLGRIRDLSWVQRTTTFGIHESPPGAAPRTEYDSTCQFQIQARRFHSESLKLIDYFPAFEEINQRCIRTSTLYNGGSIRIGVTGSFVVILSRKRTTASGSNGTLVPGDLTGLMGAETA